MSEHEQIVRHFTRRAPNYDASSHWCTDDSLVDRLLTVLQPQPADVVVDVACGTALVARALRPHVARVVGVDITPEMLEQGRPHLDEAILADAEAMPLADHRFDLVVCRQGIQFLNAPAAVAEMVRVTRPGGRVCLVNLCAYGTDDRDEFFEILRLRNPVRRNFFLREDLVRLLHAAGCRHVSSHDHVSVEVVDIWTEHAAIGAAEQARIRDLYLGASPAFRKLHRVEIDPAGRVLDRMLFGIIIGTK